jgi:Meiotically up-regulated gene 113
MNRETIIDEIKRTAVANGGTPLGVRRLDAEAGIKPHHWQRYWARLSDAHREAGLDPNSKTEPYGRDKLVALLVGLARDLGRFPTVSDLRLKCSAEGWPTNRVFDRSLGGKAEKMAMVAAYCQAHPGNENVLALCSVTESEVVEDDQAPDTSNDGFVYLLKAGRYYKIGKTNHVGRRERELAIQLPETATTVHTIKTDDPEGIEAYWHRRFATKRKNGEWFDLDRADISAFRRRRFM